MGYSFKSVQNNGGMMAEGDYEVYVKKCEEGETYSSTECIFFDFVVRADVEQPYQNKHIFKKFYKNEAGQYPSDKIGKYANALGIPEGQDFELNDLIGRNCIVHISHFIGNDGVKRECIYYTAKSKAEPYMSVPPASDFAMLEDDDAQLPF